MEIASYHPRVRGCGFNALDMASGADGVESHVSKARTGIVAHTLAEEN